MGVIQIRKKVINKSISSKEGLKAFILIFGFSILVGFIAGSIANNFLDRNNSTIIEGSSLVSSIMRIVSFILVFIVSSFVHIIIHELGHLIFGLATGYKFVSYRVGSLTLIREEGKFKFKKYNIPGTAGQCHMVPADAKDCEYQFVLYYLGGSILNAIVSIISILSLVHTDIRYPFSAMFVIFTAIGFYVVIASSIPLKVSGITNDAYNVKTMIKDNQARRSMYIQLRASGLLSQGVRFRDIDPDLFKLEKPADVINPLNTNIKLMEYDCYLDRMNFENAKNCIDSFIPYLDEIIPLYVNEINCERVFLELIGDCDKNLIDDLYDEQLKEYITRAKYMISKTRLLMVYEAFYNEDNEKALDYYQKLIDLYNHYPIKGEADMELMIADWVKESLLEAENLEQDSSTKHHTDVEEALKDLKS